MHCTSCAMVIDGDLEDTDGVKNVCTNFARSETEIEFDEEIIDEQVVVEIIAKSGYHAVIKSDNEK